MFYGKSTRKRRGSDTIFEPVDKAAIGILFEKTLVKLCGRLLLNGLKNRIMWTKFVHCLPALTMQMKYIAWLPNDRYGFL